MSRNSRLIPLVAARAQPGVDRLVVHAEAERVQRQLQRRRVLAVVISVAIWNDRMPPGPPTIDY